MSEDKEVDIYLQLVNDMLDKPLSEEELRVPILQHNNDNGNHNHNSPAWKINNSLSNSCQLLKTAIGSESITVGAQSGYVEPCPISYTGSVINNDKKFNVVFIGLNPFLEGPRDFPADTSYVDLANIHHPHDIIHETGKEYNKIHQYRRILGCRENKTDWGAWSPFYKDVIRIYLALLPKGSDEWYSKWPDLQEKGRMLAIYSKNYIDKEDKKHERVKKEFKASMALQKYLLEKLKNNPFASAELIPYKSENFSANKIIDLLKSKKDPIHEKYHKYFWDIFRFIDKHSTDKAYIIITARKNDVNPLKTFLTSQNTDIIGIPNFEFKASMNLGAKKQITFNLIKWGKGKKYRRIVIMPSISRSSQYGQVLQEIGDKTNGWVHDIKVAFNDL